MAISPLAGTRIDRLRDLMDERGYDAVILRNTADLRWLTGVPGVFDDETAHTAFVTPKAMWLHTDSRYFNALREGLGPNTYWQLDQDVVSAAAWAAQRTVDARARVVAIEDSVELAFFDDLQVELARASVAPALPRLHADICDLRMVKDQDELFLLNAAQEITDAAFEDICAQIAPGMTEKQVRAALEASMLAHGADGLSFETIIAAGPNGANPHARPSDYVICEGDLVVMDYGALLGDYHADMTRTVCVGEPSERQRAVYEVVRRAHEECAQMLKPGVIGREVHEHSVKVIAEAGFGDYYGHGLGHGVGIEIHERPNLGRLYDKPIPAMSVVTVEPGIYLPGEFGIRLEDCGVVTEDGYAPFTAASHELRVIPV